MGQRQPILGGIIILFLAVLFTRAGAQTPTTPAVLINEVITDPQQDWSDNTGGNGVPFDATPGTGTISSTDEWLELLNVGTTSIDLSNWTLDMIDTTPATLEFSDPGNTAFQFSQGGSITNFQPGERLVIGNPPGAMNNDLFLVLRDAGGNSVDDVEIGDAGQPGDGAPAPGKNGNASSPADEAIARLPDGIDTDDDAADFAQQAATIGTSNGEPPTPTLSPTSVQASSVLINEVVTDPQTDWSTAGFDGTDGGGTISQGVDEWIELLINAADLDLTHWTIELRDTSPVIGDLTDAGAFQVSRYIGAGSFTKTQAGDRLILGNVAGSGAMNDDIFIVLKDVTGLVVDDVEIGFDPEGDGDDGAPEAGQDGNATGPGDEAIARVPDGVDTDNDISDFAKQAASLGATNPAPTATPTATPDPTATSTPTSTSTSTATYTPSSTPTTTATATQSITPTSTSTSTGTPTPSPTATGTRSPSATASATSTPTATPSASTTATDTPTATATATHMPTTTETATGTPTKTPTATWMATDTPTATPTFTTTSTPSATAIPFQPRSIVINEVAWMGTQAHAADEWIELKNNSGQLINLAGWTLESDDGSPHIALAGTIPANGYFLLERTDDNTVSDIAADFIYTGSLSNSGETLTLRDPAGTIIDTANGDGGPWPAGDNTTKSTMERIDPTMPDTDSNWATNDGITRNGTDAGGNPINGTPKQANAPMLLLTTTATSSPTISPTPTATFTRTPTPTTTPTPTPTPASSAPGSVLINEVVTDPQQDWNDTAGGNDMPFDNTPGTGAITSSDEWLELLNTADHSIDLTGWSLIMTDRTPATQVLGQGSAILRFSAGGSLTNFQPGERLVIGNPTGALNNDTYIELRDATGHVIDDVEIGDDFESDGIDGAPGAGQNGNALTIYDEAVARVPDGWDTNDDRADFEKRPATIGNSNGVHAQNLALLPGLNTLLAPSSCEATIEIQNVGAIATKAIILFWADAGPCPPQCAGPFHVTCTGLLKPGSSWHLNAEQLPPNARAGAVFSAFGLSHPAFEDGGDVFADALCEALFDKVQGNCDEYRRFRQAFDERAVWDAGIGYPDFNFAAFPGQPIAVEVKRICRSDTDPATTSAYIGTRGRDLGLFDPLFGGYAYYAPLVYAGWHGWDSALHIQNAGLECASVELWFRPQGECRRSQVCEIPALAPGESRRFDAGDCVGPDWEGSVWLRSAQPAAIIVDTTGLEALTTYQAMPAELNYTIQADAPFQDQPAGPLFTPGSQVNYGPLIFREHQGWDTRIQVQNLSSVLNAKVKVYFLDEGGDVIHSVVDWICPRGSQAYTLAAISHLPGDWVGQVRVESQNWFAPGSAGAPAPNIVSVAQLVRWNGPAQAVPLEAMSYNLLPEEQVFDWQTGSGAGGLESGTGLIGIPSLSDFPTGSMGPATQLAIQNAVTRPGSTDFILFLYDQNGLLDMICQRLNARQVEYINLMDWGYVNSRFRGSAVISAVVWQHPVVDPTSGSVARNLLGLAAVKTERFRASPSSLPLPAGDQASASVGIPLAGPFDPNPIFSFDEHQPTCPH